MLADVDLISFLISRKLNSWYLFVFDVEGGGLVFESSFGPILTGTLRLKVAYKKMRNVITELIRSSSTSLEL